MLLSQRSRINTQHQRSEGGNKSIEQHLSVSELNSSHSNVNELMKTLSMMHEDYRQYNEASEGAGMTEGRSVSETFEGDQNRGTSNIDISKELEVFDRRLSMISQIKHFTPDTRFTSKKM